MLLLDDDVEFEPEFVEREFVAMQKVKAQCGIVKMHNDASANRSGLKRKLNHWMGSEVYKDTHDQFLFKINQAGGFIVNTGIDPSKPAYSQIGHGSNCLCSVEHCVRFILRRTMVGG